MFGRGAAGKLTNVFRKAAATRIRLPKPDLPNVPEVLVVGSIAAFQQLIPLREIPAHTYLAITLVFAQAVLIGFLLAERMRRITVQSQRDKAHAALKESEAKNTAILSALPDLMFVIHEDGTYLDWYAADASDLYVSPEQFLGRNMREIMPPALAEQFVAVFKGLSTSGKAARVEYSLTMHNQQKSFEARIVQCGPSKFLSIVRDVTEQKQTEMQLQQLSSRLLSLQDDERRRIARELHDSTAQNLFAITVNLENLQDHKIGLPPKSLEVVRECQELCEQSLREVRTLSYVMHPPALEHIGLIPTLQWYIDGFIKRSGIDVQLQADQGIGRLPIEMEVDLFRVVQEGLSNVLRHSGSRVATVAIQRQTDQVVLQIQDHGRGLSDDAADNTTDRFGIGIPSMRERLRRAGGQLEVKSAGDGVVLVAQVPVPLERVVA